jgi:phosphatidylglycerophosphate synthase
MTVQLPREGRRVTELWTFVAVDPLARPLSERLARLRPVTPNRLTALALTLGLASAGCFVAGQPRVGGALFILRFFVDCLDGRVARLQGTCSTRGAFFDLAADVLGVTAAYASLGWFLVDAGHLDMGWVLALLGALGVYNWGLGQRKTLAAEAGLGTGGAAHRWSAGTSPVGRWLAFCESRGVSAVPWAVECEIATLGLAPLLLPSDWLGASIAAALAFYVVADLLNARRTWRIATLLDHRRDRP